MQKRAVIYCRISKDEEELRLGVQRQEQDCRALVERVGWQLVDVVVDNSVSAYSGKRRPGYERVVDLVKNLDVDVVVVWHPDRLHRSPRELEDFIDLLEDTGATVATVTAGDWDLATPEGRLTARIVGSVARKESEDKSRRLRRKHQELADLGKVSGGGARPYGYGRDRKTIVEAEALVIREAAQMVLDGASLRGVCVALNERGVPTAQGRRWVSQVLRPMLTSARIAGLREHEGRVVPAEWPAIITPAEHARLRALLLDPARRTQRPPKRYLLSGLVRCGRCQQTMVSRPRFDGVRGYACQSGPPWFGCGRMFIQAEPLERVVEAAVLRVLSGRSGTSPVAVAVAGGSGHSAAAADAAAEAIREDEAQLEQLAEAHGTKAITLAEWMAARRPIVDRLEGARAALAATTVGGAVERLLAAGEDLSDRFATLDLDRKRAVVAGIMEFVPIEAHDRARGREFQPDRIGEPKWRA